MTAKMSLVIWIGVVMLTLAIPMQAQTDDQGWISLFDGSFNGWKAAEKENAGTFTIKDGVIVAHGPRNHLFYVGPVHYGDFRDFELKVDVMAEENSNGGIYFHTQYQDRTGPPGASRSRCATTATSATPARPAACTRCRTSTRRQ